MPNSSFGNPFVIPQVQVTSLRPTLPDASQSLAALMKMQAAQERLALAAARGSGSGRRGPQEGDPRYGRYAFVPQKDGTKKQVWVWGISQKERDAAEQRVVDEAAQAILNDDEALQKDLAQFESLSVPGRKEVLDRVRQNHAPRLAKILGVPGEVLSKQLTTGLDASIRQREKEIDSAGLGTQLLYAGKQIYRNIKDAIGAIGETPQQQLARGRASAEAAAQDARENAFADELNRLDAENRGSIGFQLSNPLRSAVMHATPLAAMIAPAIAGGAVAGPAGAVIGGAIGAGLPAGGEALQRVATDPNLTETQKEESVGDTALLSGVTAGAIGAIPIGPAALLRPAARAAMSRAVPAAVPYRMLPGATAEEVASVGSRWVAEQTARSSPNIFREIPSHSLNAATLGGAFQFGTNAAYNAGTGQSLPLTEGLGEAIAAGAVLGVPFGAVARMRQRVLTPEQRAQLTVPNLTPLDDMGVSPSAYASGDAGAMPPPIITSEPKLAGRWTPEQYNAWLANEQRAWDAATRQQEMLRNNYLQRREQRKTQVEQPETVTLDINPDPMNILGPRQAESEPKLNLRTPLFAPNPDPLGILKQTNSHIRSKRTLAERGGTPIFEEQSAVVTNPDPLGVFPENRPGAPGSVENYNKVYTELDNLSGANLSKKSSNIIESALNTNDITLEQAKQILSEFTAKEKTGAKNVKVKGIDKGIKKIEASRQPPTEVIDMPEQQGVITSGNRNTDTISSASEPAPVMEPVRQTGQGEPDTADIITDSTVPANTETAAPTIANTNIAPAPASSPAPERRGNAGAEPQDTGSTETPARTPDEQGIGGEEGTVRERSIEPAAPANAAGSAGEREPQPAPELRERSAGNAEQTGSSPDVIIRASKKSPRLTSDIQNKLTDGTASVDEIRKQANDTPEKWKKNSLAQAVTLHETAQKLPDTLAGANKKTLKTAQKFVRDEIKLALQDRQLPEDTIKDLLANKNWEEIQQMLAATGTVLPVKVNKFVEELAQPFREKRQAEREKERLAAQKEMPLVETATEEASVAEIPVDTSKPFTERTYNIARKNMASLLAKKLQQSGMTKDLAQTYVKDGDWEAIKERLQNARQLDATTEQKLNRFMEYEERIQSEQIIKDVETTIDAALKDPTPEKMLLAQDAIDKASIYVDDIVGRDKLEEARLKLEERAKPESEPQASDLTALRDKKIAEEDSGIIESEYIAPEDLAIIKTRFWELARDNTNGPSTLESLVGDKKIGTRADGVKKTPEELVETLTDIYRKFYERSFDLTKSEINTYKKMKAWLELNGVTEMPRQKGTPPLNYDEIVNSELIENLKAMSEFAVEEATPQAQTSPFETHTGPYGGVYQKQLNSLSRSLNKRFAKIWPNKEKIPAHINDTIDAFIKAAMGEKLTPKEQSLYNEATAKGVKSLALNKSAVEDAVRLAKDRGYENFTTIDAVKRMPSESAEELVTKPWC